MLLTRLTWTLLAASLLGPVVAPANVGTFSAYVRKPTVSGSTANVSCDLPGGGAAVLTVTASSIHVQTCAQASIPFTIVYIPANGETHLPKTAYVRVDFIDTLQVSSARDGAYALDPKDKTTIADELDAKHLKVESGASSYFRSVRVVVRLGRQPDGTLAGSFRVNTNVMKAVVRNAPFDLASASQVVIPWVISRNPLPPRDR